MPWAFGLFAGKDFEQGEVIGGDDGGIHIPLFDTKVIENNEKIFRPGIDISDDLYLQSSFRILSFLPGIGSMYVCVQDNKNNRSINNVVLDRKGAISSNGVHRDNNPSFGSFSYRHAHHFRISQPTAKGQELFLSSCPSGLGPFRWEYSVRTNSTATQESQKIPTPVKWMTPNDPIAFCVDVFTVQKSDVAPGWGAFAKRSFQKGQRVISSPVALLHRNLLEIMEQYVSNDGELSFKDNIKQWQLLLNYAYGHPESNLLFLPYGPGGIHYINHASHGQEPNVRVQWSTSELSDNSLLEMSVLKAMNKDGSRLFVDYVTLRDIHPGEEILLDYGKMWEDAWQMHVDAWHYSTREDPTVRAAHDIRTEKENGNLRTLLEQEINPYPENIMTACLYQAVEQYRDESSGEEVHFHTWEKDNEGCLRPCILLERRTLNTTTVYDVLAQQINNHYVSPECSLPNDIEHVHQVPEDMIFLVDTKSDELQPGSFRHEIHVPDEMYPLQWRTTYKDESSDDGDFEKSSLLQDDISHIRWANGEVVTPNAYQIRLEAKIRQELLAYANRMGITEKFRDFVVRGNQLEPGEEKQIELHGMSFWAQRTSEFWKSSMHWISPADSASHGNYLQALSMAGFDEVLSTIGKRFGFKGLCAFHLTFIGVSYCCPEGGFIHRDMSGTAMRKNETRAFNVIIPLILSNETNPELDLASDGWDKGTGKMGRYRYQYDVGVLLGDDAVHATSSVDYRDTRQMRMAATVYIADIAEDNVEEIMAFYTQKYPPNDRELLLSMASAHWNSQDPSVRLPKPNSTFHALKAIDRLQDISK